MKEKPLKNDAFVIDGNVIVCYAKSGNKYIITKDEICKCKGFTYHHECRHLDQARKMGLIDELKAQKEEISSPMSFYNSPVVKKERLAAIRAFLTKQNISFDDSMVNNIESKLTSQTKPEELLTLA